MKPVEIHPADAKWLRRWLRSNLVCGLAICGFLLLVGIRSDRPSALQARTGVSSQVTAEILSPARPVEIAATNGPQGEDHFPPESELVLLANRPSISVAPEGWRRTSEGWEHVSTWQPIARPLGEIVMEQEAREPRWMQAGLAKVRDVPPLAFALLQIAAISAIVGVARTERREDLKRIAVSN